MQVPQVYCIAAGFGAVAGSRSMMAPAAIAWAARSSKLSLHGTPARGLASWKGSRLMTALAAGELVADKLPVIPKRTSPPALAARIVSGAVAGALVCRKRNFVLGGLIGAVSAVASTFCAYELRRRATVDWHLPDAAVAAAEDALAIGSSAVLVSALANN